jgi:hypothetical protein
MRKTSPDSILTQKNFRMLPKKAVSDKDITKKAAHWAAGLKSNLLKGRKNSNNP